MGGGGRVSVVRIRWCFFFIFVLATTSSARHIVSFSGNNVLVVSDDQEMMKTNGRSLKAAHLDDYNDPSANKGHEPRNRHQAGGRGSGNRKT